jgi:hypothetical protein
MRIEIVEASENKKHKNEYIQNTKLFLSLFIY